MKLFNFYTPDGVHIGAMEQNRAVDVTGAGYMAEWQEILSGGQKALQQVRRIVEHGRELELSKIRFAPAVLAPEKILCIGLNYAEHTAEAHMEIPKYPTLFSKFNNALNAHGAPIYVPKTAHLYDYEAELVVVIGKEAKYIDKEKALEYVFGYTIGNDFSARELQGCTPQWLLGKTSDGFAPVGPYIVPAGELDAANLSLQSYVNGELRQNGNTKDMIFDIPTIVSYISQYMTLKPGDIIFTGTPKGVILGYPKAERVWLRAGDEVTVKIEGIGELKNYIA